MKTTQTLLLWAMVATCGCLDLKLLDEMLRADAGIETTGDSTSPHNENTQESNLPVPDPNDTNPPTLAVPSCGDMELRENRICIAEGPISASLHFVTDEPAEVSLFLEGSGLTGVLSAPWSTEHHIAITALEPGASTGVTLSVKDINGNENALDIPVVGQDGPTVAITEVLADPNGPEPAQEFVEITNFGPLEIDLSGWMIDDNGDANGGNNLVAENTVLGPGQVAVVVSASYDPAEGQDPAPDPSALLITLPATVCSNGLKNSEAETVELYDASGMLVSQYRGQAGNPREGCSAARRTAELPDDDKLAFGTESSGSSTPGHAPTL
jgi:hypothetical protein